MFPPKINEFVRSLISQTESGLLSWDYDDENSIVHTEGRGFSVSLTYSFNQIEEIGEFSMRYYSAQDQKEYRFYTNQEYKDYDIARRLFDTAQSSGISLPF
ncbi:hypothetical protein [Pseudomonas viridiflava]|jgi:hypothetical protein|uniref:hypothetical protein n=1 Tax=Pseudomonas viridiflava TaxID=33069 RepID=UPI000F04211D|nr:hypothetical protein [Pseudomonas viridiflava]WKW32528.1 hypothetical protein KIH13_00500 [Pseudomonas viridiflava]